MLIIYFTSQNSKVRGVMRNFIFLLLLFTFKFQSTLAMDLEKDEWTLSFYNHEIYHHQTMLVKGSGGPKVVRLQDQLFKQMRIYLQSIINKIENHEADIYERTSINCWASDADNYQTITFRHAQKVYTISEKSYNKITNEKILKTYQLSEIQLLVDQIKSLDGDKQSLSYILALDFSPNSQLLSYREDAGHKLVNFFKLDESGDIKGYGKFTDYHSLSSEELRLIEIFSRDVFQKSKAGQLSWHAEEIYSYGKHKDYLPGTILDVRQLILFDKLGNSICLKSKLAQVTTWTGNAIFSKSQLDHHIGEELDLLISQTSYLDKFIDFK
jgi:hypothetical protein